MLSFLTSLKEIPFKLEYIYNHLSLPSFNDKLIMGDDTYQEIADKYYNIETNKIVSNLIINFDKNDDMIYPVAIIVNGQPDILIEFEQEAMILYSEQVGSIVFEDYNKISMWQFLMAIDIIGGVIEYTEYGKTFYKGKY